MNGTSLLRPGRLCAAVLLACVFSLDARAQGAGYWHTSGNKILDANGAQVRLAGVNWYGFETKEYLADGLWAQDYKTVLNTIKTLGYNVIRIPFSNQLVESDPVPTNYTTYANGSPANTALVGQTALEDLDTIVAYAGSIGLRVILDNHVSEAGGNNEADGLWYTSAYPQANWIADWQTMAARYSAARFTFNGNPTVIGVDLRNEPHLLTNSGSTGGCWTGDTETSGSYKGCPATLTAQNWPVAATAAGDAVLAVNPSLLIFVEGTDCYNGTCGWEGGNLIGVAAHPVKLSVANRLVYSAHDYGPNLYQESWFNGSTTPASLDAVWNTFWGYISAAGTAPVWLGEFGTDNTATDIENTAAGSQGQWFQSMVSYLHANPSINWTYWALNGEDTYGLLDSNYDPTPASALKQSLLKTIQFPLGVTKTPAFTLSDKPTGVTLVTGTTAVSTVTIHPAGGFAGNVTFAIGSLPGGVTAGFNPVTGKGSSTLTLTASTAATLGKSVVSINGTSGALTGNTTLALNVAKPQVPGYSLAASPASLSLSQGASTASAITVKPSGGFEGTVALAASGLPSGVTARFAPDSTTSASTLTLTAASTAATGASTVTVTGKSGTLSKSVKIPLTVSAPASAGGPAGFSGKSASNGPYFDEDDVAVTTTAPITALTLTITVPAGGLSYSAQYQTIGTQIVSSHSSGANIVYTFALTPGQTIGAGSFTFGAQMQGNGTTHAYAGDSWSVTYTSGGATYTQSGVI